MLNLNKHTKVNLNRTRRPASADRTARRQVQATGQPVSRTQTSDAMTSGEVRATQVLPMRFGPFAFRYQGKAIDCATTLPLKFFM